MKHVYFLFCSMLILFIYGCKETVIEHKEVDTLEESVDENLNLIRDGLYEDENGQLYLRTIDVSILRNPVYSYGAHLMVDTIINGEETFYTPLISDFIDKETFHLVPCKYSGEGLEMKCYEDKNGSYFLLVVADGGTLNKS